MIAEKAGLCAAPFGERWHCPSYRNHRIIYRIIESQNHRMLGVGRDLCGSSSPTLLPKQGHLQQAAQNLVQESLEYLQRRRIHYLPGQPVPVLRHPQSEEVLLPWKVGGSFRLEKTLRSSSPTINLTLPSPPLNSFHLISHLSLWYYYYFRLVTESSRDKQTPNSWC